MADRRSPVPYGTPNFEWFMAINSRTDDGPVHMINLMKYHERAQYADGSDGGVSGKEADDRYAPVAVLREIGARVVLHADVDSQLDGTPTWDRIGIVEYPSRAEFLAMQQRPDFAKKHEHKAAGMKETIVMASLPLPLPDVQTAAVEPDPADPPMILMQVIRFAGPDGRDEMARHSALAAGPALELGIRPLAWYTVEATVVGDGRQWDEVRFNWYPRRSLFDTLIADPRHAEGREHRAKAVEESFVALLTPMINHF